MLFSRKSTFFFGGNASKIISQFNENIKSVSITKLPSFEFENIIIKRKKIEMIFFNSNTKDIIYNLSVT